MKIEVKNIKTNMAFSEETICFKADVYVDGKKVAYAENNGHGEFTNVRPYGIEHKQVFKDAMEYLSSKGTSKYEEIYSLENFVDDAINSYVDEKENKKFETKKNKHTEKFIVICKENEKDYTTIGFGKHTIAELMKFDAGRNAIKKSIDKYKGLGYSIYNKNIPTEILN
jgi:hypothetical protein